MNPLSLALCFWTAASSPHAPIECQPYALALRLDDQRSAASESADPETLARLRSAVTAVGDGAWDVTSEACIPHGARGRLSRVTPAEVATWPGLRTDEIVTIVEWRTSGALWTVRVRIVEPLFEHASPVRECELADERLLSRVTADLLKALVRPRIRWERGRDSALRVRYQAAALGPQDPGIVDRNASTSLPGAQPGSAEPSVAATAQATTTSSRPATDDTLAGDDAALALVVSGPKRLPANLFTPWILLRGKPGVPDRATRQPWTLIRVAAAATGDLAGLHDAEVLSGLRSPLSVKVRPRVEFWGIAAVPLWPATEVVLTTQSIPSVPLGACPMELTPIPPTSIATEVGHPIPAEPATAAAPVETTPSGTASLSLPSGLILTTDRRGRAWLPAMSAEPCWLAIRSGSQPLAKLPVIPGAEPRLPIMLPDDRLRLQVEGQLQIVQSDLIEHIARRSALMGAIRLLARQADWPAVDARLKQLQAQPSLSAYQERIAAIRVPAVAAARQQKDRTTELRVGRLCDDALVLVARYLDNDRLKQFQEEIAELRAAK